MGTSHCSNWRNTSLSFLGYNSASFVLNKSAYQVHIDLSVFPEFISCSIKLNNEKANISFNYNSTVIFWAS